MSVNQQGDHILDHVCGNGPGIPAEEREEVFQRLYRLDSSRSTPGSGLGLSLVRAIADLHGATISLEDKRPGCRSQLSGGEVARRLKASVFQLTNPYE
ncbi:sensor histidine kinase [Mesorhizobium sp. B1-1-8]|uniref:sensor histidine kinase n=1 Tax=Mesorhizobium sp. B1-1-8 TaxID=2589976 RepID=UPI0039B018E8